MFQWGACWELHSAFDCFDCLHSRIRANLLLFTQNRAPQSLIRMDCLHFPRCTERITYNSTFLIYSRSCAKKLTLQKYIFFFIGKLIPYRITITWHVMFNHFKKDKYFLKAQNPSKDRYLVIWTLRKASGIFLWFSCFHQSAK